MEFERVTHPAPAPRFSRTYGKIQSSSALSGEHTDEVLAEWGFDVDKIEELKVAGAI